MLVYKNSLRRAPRTTAVLSQPTESGNRSVLGSNKTVVVLRPSQNLFNIDRINDLFNIDRINKIDQKYQDIITENIVMLIAVLLQEN